MQFRAQPQSDLVALLALLHPRLPIAINEVLAEAYLFQVPVLAQPWHYHSFHMLVIN